MVDRTDHQTGPAGSRRTQVEVPNSVDVSPWNRLNPWIKGSAREHAIGERSTRVLLGSRTSTVNELDPWVPGMDAWYRCCPSAKLCHSGTMRSALAFPLLFSQSQLYQPPRSPPICTNQRHTCQVAPASSRPSSLHRQHQAQVRRRDSHPVPRHGSRPKSASADEPSRHRAPTPRRRKPAKSTELRSDVHAHPQFTPPPVTKCAGCRICAAN